MMAIAGFSGRLSSLPNVPFASVAALAAEGVIASVIGHFAYFWALRLGSVSQVVPITSAFPLVALLWGLAFLGERITLARIAGALMITAGVLIIRL